MSLTVILLLAWPVASLVGGPMIGRFVAVRMDEPEAMPERAPPGALAAETESGQSTIGLLR